MLVLAFDTAGDVLAVAVGRYDDVQPSDAHPGIGGDAARLAGDEAAAAIRNAVRATEADSFDGRLVATHAEPAARHANTRLLPSIQELFDAHGLSKDDIGAVVCGRGPGSFTGVRIGVATAKGVARGLDVPLFGVSTAEAVAWGAWQAGVRGPVGLVGDALRKEIYPVRFQLDDAGVERQDADTVDKPVATAARWAAAVHDTQVPVTLVGGGLRKHRVLFEEAFSVQGVTALCTYAADELGDVTGAGLLRAFEDTCRQGCAGDGEPGEVLPVYTRLSDAEENERIRLATTGQVKQGVIVDAQAQAAGPTVVGEQQVVGPAVSSADGFARSAAADVPRSGVAEDAAADGILYRPLSINDMPAMVEMERELFGDAAWTSGMLADEFDHQDRTWWIALHEGRPIGYGGAQAAAGTLDVLRVGTRPAARRHGVATALMQRICHDGIDLGCDTVTLEVRAGNEAARGFYGALGLSEVGRRPAYYPPAGADGVREDALLMNGSLPAVELRAEHAAHTRTEDGAWLAGMELEQRAAVTAEAGDCAHPPLILAIESSCDETAAAVIDGAGAQLADAVASQIDFHARFGGVVPEIASRKHTEAIVGVVDETMARAGRELAARDDAQPLAYRQLDAIAVTQGPGLIGALVVGVAFAKGLSWATDVPLIGVNHLEGHIYANRIANPHIEPPFIVSLLSGGHTMLVHVKDWGSYEVLGQTLDDAVGEAFDKVSKALGLGYPGGPVISRYALKGDPGAIEFPRAMMHSGDYTFSLSGLKTAVITYLKGEAAAGRAVNVADVAASFQQAVIDVQVSKALTACEQTGCTEFCLGGGVAANRALREACTAAMEREGIHVTLPPLSACTDNASMIAAVALDTYRKGPEAPKRDDGLGGFLTLASDATARFPL